MIIFKRKKSSLIIAVIAIVFSLFCFFILAANVSFVEDTKLDLENLPTNLYVKSGSQCDSLKISGSLLTVEIPKDNTFTLVTGDYLVLALTPLEGKATLNFNTLYFQTGYLQQWTVSSETSNTKINFSIGVPKANTYYLVKVDGKELNYYLSSSLKIVDFSFNQGFSQRIFTIEEKQPPASPLIETSLPPKPPKEGFKVIINEGAKKTSKREVLLKLIAGPDTKKMAISENPDFKGASQEKYQPIKKWILSEGEGKKTIYVKFYNQYGIASPVISASIILELKEKEIIKKEEKKVIVAEIKTEIAKIQKRIVVFLKKLIQLLKERIEKIQEKREKIQ